MERNDFELVRSILSGDDSAFSELVEKYQKSVHALAWREVGDFQVAEEIAQDTFLQAYKKLATLKNAHQFAGWLYVIARNLCKDWHRRKKPTMQSLEATNRNTLDQSAYERFVEEQREKAAADRRRELVKNLLDKLPESERTVMTLYYLGEMTSETISRFLGVSVNTIRSRLRRARMRLKEEEPMIRDTLGSVQLPNNFTQNIMDQITHIKPTPISNAKPLLPWAALGSAAVLVFILMGASNQFITHFQKPYSLEAQSETSIEIINAPVVLDIQSEIDSQRRIGSNALANKNGGAGQHASDTLSVSDPNDESSNISVLTDQWTQAIGPETGNVHEIFLTSKGELYTVSPTGIYKMTEDESGWVLINNTVPAEFYSQMPMAEYKDVLYIVSSDEIFASADGGVIWKSIGLRPNGSVIELLITDDTLYIVMHDKIFRSIDAGKQWTPFNVGIKNREIFGATAIGNTIFIGTDRGVYRLNSDQWEQLSVGTFRSVNSITVSDNTLYVSTSPNDIDLTPTEMKTKLIREIMRNEKSNRWELFRSDDLGETWDKITPSKRSFIDYFPMGGKIIAIEKTLLAIGSINIYRSNDKGETWTNLGIDVDALSTPNSSIVAVNENTLYKESIYKLQRSTDGGKSWHPFMKGIIGSRIKDVVAYNDRLYAHAGTEIVQSSDGGNTWTNLQTESGKEGNFIYPNMTVDNNTFFAIVRDEGSSTRICSLGSNGNQLVPVPEMPAVSGDIANNNFNNRDNSRHYINLNYS
ncbi:MAG: sigma-70 family RNA polymerase sigma factor [Candidatus Poribacteria bacterium]|nr:sigma-70 family RNA polymerase sigma factor [Candidatus Poribacteria bacterium]